MLAALSWPAVGTYWLVVRNAAAQPAYGQAMNGRITLLSVLFLVAFVYELETLKGDTTRALYAIANRSPQVAQPHASTDRTLTALALVVSNELSYFSEVATSVVNKLHPDLKADLRYSAFKVAIQNRRSTQGTLRFTPLVKAFAEDYATLEARYEKEFPGETMPSN
jgi:hypothetical protein